MGRAERRREQAAVRKVTRRIKGMSKAEYERFVSQLLTDPETVRVLAEAVREDANEERRREKGER